MAKPFFSSATRYPLTLKPVTSPDNKPTHLDIFNIQNTLRSLLRDIDTLFLGQTLSTPPPNDEVWVDAGAGGESYQDASEQRIVAAEASATPNLITRVRDRTLDAPYKFTAAIHSQFVAEDFVGCGILIADPAGSIHTIGIRGTQVEVITHTATADVLVSYKLAPSYPQWYRIIDDGTDTSFQFCADGESWNTLHTLPSSTTHTDVGFWVSNENFPITARLFSWRVEPL